jgi:hypothetical protein
VGPVKVVSAGVAADGCLGTYPSIKTLVIA